MAETVFSSPSAFEQVGFVASSIRARAGLVRQDLDLDEVLRLRESHPLKAPMKLLLKVQAAIGN